MSIYTDAGYENRKEYLLDLAANYDVPREVVFTLASMLGPNEDFDGLIVELEDYELYQEGLELRG